MWRRWFRSLTLIAAAALLLNSQCYALCAISACSAKIDCTSHCQHRKSHSEKSDSGQVCHAQHSEFVNPERGAILFKLTTIHIIPAAPSVSVGNLRFVDRHAARCCLNQSERAGYSGTSVFAVLSSFRI